MKKKIFFWISKIIVKIYSIKRTIFKYYNTQLLSNVNSHPLWVGGDTMISNPTNIQIGRGSYINGGYLMAGQKSKIIIGENCLISYNVHIRTNTHNTQNTAIPIIEQGDYEKDIQIGDNVWIGHAVQIMPGIKIGDNCIVGAGSIVTKSFGDNLVIAGVPAKVIKVYK